MLLRSLPLTFDSFVIPKLAFLGVSAALGLAFWAVSGQSTIRTHPAAFAAAALVGLAVFSTVFALDPAVSLFGRDAANGLIAYLAYLGVLFLILQQADSTGPVRTLTRAVVGSGSVAAGVSLYQAALMTPDYVDRLGLGDVGYLYGRGGGLFGNPDFVGSFLVVPTLLAVALVFAEQTPLNKWLAGIASGLMGAALIITQVRAGWLGVLIGLVVVLVILGRRRFLTTRTISVGAGIAVAAVLLGILIAGPQLILRRVTETFASGLDAASSGRLSGWRDALSVIGDRPLLGTGPDSFTLGWYHHASTLADRFTGAQSYFEDPHNFYLAIAATMGIPALIALLVMIFFAARSGLANLRMTSSSMDKSALYGGWFAAFVGLLVTLVFAVNTIPTTLMFFVVVAVLASPTASRREAGTTGELSLRVIGGVAALMILVGALLPFVADYHLGQFMRTKSAASLQRARALAPWEKTVQLQYLNVRKAEVSPLLPSGGAPALQAVDSFDTEAFRLVQAHPHELLYSLERIDLLGRAAGELGPAVGEKNLVVVNMLLADYPDLEDLHVAKARALNNLDRYDEAVAQLEPLDRSVQRDIALVESYLLDGRKEDGGALIDRIRADYRGSQFAEFFLSQPTIAPFAND